MLVKTNTTTIDTKQAAQRLCHKCGAYKSPDLFDGDNNVCLTCQKEEKP